MFFRKAQFQRDGHARCNLLLTRTLLRHGTDLSPVGRRALTGIIHHSLYARVIADNRHRQGLHNCKSAPYPFEATLSIVPGTGPVMRLCHRLQLAPSRSPHVVWSFVESLVANHPPPHASRSGTPQTRTTGTLATRRVHKGLVRLRASE